MRVLHLELKYRVSRVRCYPKISTVSQVSRPYHKPIRPRPMIRITPGTIPSSATTDGRDKIPNDTVSANMTRDK